MRDNITPVMQQRFMPMFERDIASAESRNMTPVRPNLEFLIPSNLFASPPQSPTQPPHHTNSLPPSDTEETHSTPSNLEPQTPPRLVSQQPQSPALTRLLARSRQQQWILCAPEQADPWKPTKPEVENLDKELREQVRFASPHNAAADANAEEDPDSKQKECQQKQNQPPRTPSPHLLPSYPPNGSLPTEPIPYNNNANGPTTPALHYIDHQLLKVQTQRRADEETPSTSARGAEAHNSSESALSEMLKDNDNDDAATVLGDDADEEEMGGALYRCEERAGAINESQGLEVVEEWTRSWWSLQTIVEAI